MNANIDLKKLYFPHMLPNFKQKKELSFVYCYSFRFSGEEQIKENEEYKLYLQVSYNFNQNVTNFIKYANKKLVGREADNMKATRVIKYEIFNRDQGDNSATFDLKTVPRKDIEDLNSFLITTGYKRKYDKYDIFTKVA